MRDFPFTGTERAPTLSSRLRGAQWVSALKGAGKEFLADDCFGLAQEIAYSALLAFFPSVILLVALLGLIGPGAYESLTHLLGPVAPKAVLDVLDLAKDSSTRNKAGSAIALALGMLVALWAASGATGSVIKAVNRASDLEETRPFWKTRMLALFLVVLTGLVTAVVFVLIVFGGPLGDAVARRADLGHWFMVLWGAAALADRLRRDPLLLLDRLLRRAEPHHAELALGDARRGGRLAPLARDLGALLAVHELLELVRPDVRCARRRDHPAPVAELLRGRAALRCGAERRARAGGRPRV